MKAIIIVAAVLLSPLAQAQYAPAYDPLAAMNQHGQQMINEIRAIDYTAPQSQYPVPPPYQGPTSTNCTSYVDAMGYTQTSCTTW